MAARLAERLQFLSKVVVWRCALGNTILQNCMMHMSGACRSVHLEKTSAVSGSSHTGSSQLFGDLVSPGPTTAQNPYCNMAAPGQYCHFRAPGPRGLAYCAFGRCWYEMVRGRQELNGPQASHDRSDAFLCAKVSSRAVIHPATQNKRQPPSALGPNNRRRDG